VTYADARTRSVQRMACAAMELALGGAGGGGSASRETRCIIKIAGRPVAGVRPQALLSIILRTLGGLPTADFRGSILQSSRPSTRTPESQLRFEVSQNDGRTLRPASRVRAGGGVGDLGIGRPCLMCSGWSTSRTSTGARPSGDRKQPLVVFVHDRSFDDQKRYQNPLGARVPINLGAQRVEGGVIQLNLLKQPTAKAPNAHLSMTRVRHLK